MGQGYQIAIETSAARGSVALGRAGEVLFEEEFELGRRPSEVLMVPLQNALNQLDGEAVELLLSGTGPGSYNGARVGIAAGQGIAIVHQCPVVGLPSPEALALARAGEPCLVLGDARRGVFFTLEIREGKLSGDPDLLDHGKFSARAEEALESGMALVSLEDPARLHLPGLEISQEVPSAGLLLDAWSQRSEEERRELRGRAPEPAYLRPPHITQPK